MYLGDNVDKNNNRFDVLLEYISNAVLIVDKQLNILTVNSAACNLFQSSKETLDQINFTKLLAPSSQITFQEKFHQLNNIPYTPFSFESAIIINHKKTSSTSYAIAIAPIYNDDNQFIEAILSITPKTQDVSHKQPFKFIFNYNPVGIGLADVNGKPILVNQALADMLGYTKQELENNILFTDLVHPDDQSKHAQGIAALLDGTSAEECFENRYIRKDKTVIWTYIMIRLYTKDKDKPLFLGSIVDLTNKKKLEADLVASEALFKSIFEMNILSIMICDMSPKIIKINQKFVDLLGYSKEELIGIAPLELTHPDDKTKHIEPLKLLQSGQEVSLDKRMVHKNGAIIWVRLFAKIIKDASGKTIIFTAIKNITQQVENQEKLTLFDIAQRELTTQTMAMAQKNIFLKEIEEFLTKLDIKAKGQAKEDIKRLKKMINSDVETKEDWTNFKAYFTSVHPKFINDLSCLYPELTQNELRHCAFIRMKLSNKEVADLLYVLPRTVEIARYRIKKKMKLEKDLKLQNYINTL